MRGILKDNSGNLWFGTDRGHGRDPLLKVEPNGNLRNVKSFTAAQKNFFKDDSTSATYVIVQDKEGIL